MVENAVLGSKLASLAKPGADPGGRMGRSPP